MTDMDQLAASIACKTQEDFQKLLESLPDGVVLIKGVTITQEPNGTLTFTGLRQFVGHLAAGFANCGFVGSGVNNLGPMFNFPQPPSLVGCTNAVSYPSRGREGLNE